MTVLDSSKIDKNNVLKILMECSNLTLDAYWKQVFEECSKGKFPKGCRLAPDNMTVYFMNGASYTMKNCPETDYLELKKMFQEHINLRSDKDRKDIRDELDGTRQTIQELFAGDWIQIRRKKLKDPIIRSFILDIKEKYNLTLLETENVYKIIRLGFMFNWIPNNAVVYEDQKILDITSLHFNPKTREFELEEKSQKYKRTYKPKKVKLSSLWAKYIARSTSQQYGYTFIF